MSCAPLVRKPPDIGSNAGIEVNTWKKFGSLLGRNEPGEMFANVGGACVAVNRLGARVDAIGSGK